MRIKSIELRNIRAVRSLTLPEDRTSCLRKHSILLGTNSTCKTSILRAIAIGLCSETHAAALLSELPGSLVGPKEPLANIKITVGSIDGSEDTVVLETTLRRETIGRSRPRQEEDSVESQTVRWNGEVIGFEDFARTQPFVCGYGAGRSGYATESRTRYRIIDSVYTLFRYDEDLQNPELLLHRLRDFFKAPGRHLLEQKLLRILGLGGPHPHRFDLTRLGIMVSGPKIGQKIPLDAVADGYRSTFTWLVDLVGWSLLANSIDRETGEIEGVVLIDELEQHLHPSLQINLLKSIAREFPNLQLIITTHSPIVPLGAKDADVFALRRERGRVRLKPPVVGLTGYTAQDVLEDERLMDTIADHEQLRRTRSEYERLMSVPPSRRTKKQKERIGRLARTLRASGYSARNPLEDQLRKLRKQLDL